MRVAADALFGTKYQLVFFLCIQHINFIVCAKCFSKHSAERRPSQGGTAGNIVPGQVVRGNHCIVCNFVLVSNSNNNQNSPKLPNVII